MKCEATKSNKQWGLLEISNPGFSLAENPLKSDNQPMKNQEKKTPLLDLVV